MNFPSILFQHFIGQNLRGFELGKGADRGLLSMALAYCQEARYKQSGVGYLGVKLRGVVDTSARRHRILNRPPPQYLLNIALQDKRGVEAEGG